MRHSSQTLRRSAAILCASGLAMSGLLLSAPTAFGANEVVYSAVDTTKPATLSLQKWAYDDGTNCQPGLGTNPETRSDGTFADLSKKDCKPLAGAEFTAYPIKYGDAAVDLSTDAGWNVIRDITEDNLFDANGVFNPTKAKTKLSETEAAKWTLGTGIKFSTGDGTGTTTLGKATFTAPKFGFYYIVETGTSGKIKQEDGTLKDVQVVKPFAPFVVTLPMAQKTTDGAGEWLYDVQADPKDKTASQPTKSPFGTSPKVLIDNGVNGKSDYDGSNDTFHWLITVTAPAYKNIADSKYNSFQVQDILPKELVKFAEGDVSSKVKVWVEDPAGKWTETKGAVSGFTASAGAVANDTQTVTIELKDATYLKGEAPGVATKIAPGDTVYVGIETQIDRSKISNGSIQAKNDFKITIDDATFADSTKDDNPSPVTDSIYATINMKKFEGKEGESWPTDNTETDKRLPGATFSFYRVKGNTAPTDAECKAAADDTKIQLGTATTQDGSTKVSSEANAESIERGTVKTSLEVWSGLRSEKPKDTNYGICVQETQAPGGYDPIKDPFAVTLSTAKATDKLVPNAKSSYVNLIKLPLTGAAGQLMLMIAGLALIGGGALWLVAARRRRNEDA